MKTKKDESPAETEETLSVEPGTAVSTIKPVVINVPEIPDVLNINGVEVSEALIQEKVDAIKKMKVDGPFDEEGIAALAEARKRIMKLRTGSNTWRTNLMKPVNTFGKDLKVKIDKFAALCALGEKAADDIMIPVNEELEKLRTEKARKAEEEFKRRVGLLIENGAVTTDGTQYTFPHDTNLFISAVTLRELELEDFEKEFVDIQASWTTETARRDKEAADKAAETAKFKAQIATLNERQTKIRLKELKFSDFLELPGGEWEKNDIKVTDDQILNLTDDEWDEMLANIENPPAAVEPEPEVSAPVSSPGRVSYGGGFSYGRSSSPAPATNLGAEFADEEEEVITQEPQAEVTPERTPFVRSFVFSAVTPSVEFEAVTGKFLQRIFPVELTEQAVADIARERILNVGEINEQLSFIIFKK